MPKLTRWKTLVALAAVAVVGIVAACLLICKAQERKEFVGSVDPVSGYRCRFTLSSAWRKYDGLIDCYPPEVEEEDLFLPAPRNPMMSWIALRLFHHVFPPANSPTIALMRLQPNTQRFHVRDGYPEPAWVNPSSPEFTLRHLRIDVFPATVVTQTNKNYRGTWLIISVPNFPVLYAVHNYDAPADITQSDREMQAIISSFHVEKVIPAGVKR